MNSRGFCRAAGWLAFLTCAKVAAQTITVPLTGSASLPDGTKATVTGTATVTLPAPAPQPSGLSLSASSLTWGKVALTPTRKEQLRLLVVTNDSAAPVTVTPQAPTETA